MKNVITILVDSVYSECIGNGRTEESSTPFIDSMIKEGIFTPNVYSYGPYTDAATKGLYCGAPSLKNYGYYYGLNSSECYHFRTFFENGYETYGFYYPYYLVGAKVRKYIDHTIYTGGFEYPAIWMGKYEYYAQRRGKGELTNDEIKILNKYTELLFDCWLCFYQKMENDEKAGKILVSIKPSLSKGEKLLKDEYEKYVKDKNKYIDELLCKGKDHIFFTLNDYVYDGAIDTAWIDKNVYRRHKKFFSQIDRKEFLYNIKNNKFSLKKCIKSKRYMQNVIICLLAGVYNKRVSKRPGWQLVASMYKKLDEVFDILEKRENAEKPFYISLHTEEPHNYVTCFSYDMKNQELIDEEIEYLMPLLKGCGRKFKGNLMYQLSLRYVDLCIKRLVDKLKELSLLDNTTIVIMADHGTSYSYYPIRDSVVNNFYKENYKTPLLIWNSDCKSTGLFTGMYSAEDVQPTICKSLGMIAPKEYTGCAVMDIPKGRKYIVTEYMGPGCPDMLSREVWMMGRNAQYSIAYKTPIGSTFNRELPVELYDLDKDPLEMNNLCGQARIYENDELRELVDAIEKRFFEIQKETKGFIDNLDSWEVI